MRPPAGVARRRSPPSPSAPSSRSDRAVRADSIPLLSPTVSGKGLPIRARADKPQSQLSALPDVFYRLGVPRQTHSILNETYVSITTICGAFAWRRRESRLMVNPYFPFVDPPFLAWLLLVPLGIFALSVSRTP